MHFTENSENIARKLLKEAQIDTSILMTKVKLVPPYRKTFSA
jgi:hypothetical protein